MAKIIEAKAVISAEDKTGGVFDKIARKIEGIAKSARSSVEDAGSSLIDVVRRAEAAIRLSGNVQSNGPGSLGLSSPDAAAPVPRPSTGGASGSW